MNKKSTYKNALIMHSENNPYAHLTPPTAIVLDLDLTVHDVLGYYYKYVNNVRKHFKLKEWKEKQFIKFYDDEVFESNHRTFERMLGSKNKINGALKIYYNLFHEENITRACLIKNSLLMLYTIKIKLKMPLFAATNCEQHLAKKILRDIKCLDFFDKVVGLKPGRRLKPYTDLLDLALGVAQIKPNKSVWFMGDSETDIECGNKAGVTTLFFVNNDKNKTTKKHMPDATVLSHTQFLDMIRQTKGL